MVPSSTVRRSWTGARFHVSLLAPTAEVFMDVTDKVKGLPENAYRKLKPGEEYVPIVPSGRIVPEATSYSVSWGLFYTILFSAAAAYLGLKIGQVFEAAIPIAILAVGMSVAAGRKNALQENVIIQSIGSSSGVIVAGAIFTIPGLYILGLDQQAGFFRIFMASLLGGLLGILFLIPFRKYFVKDMHGEFPFPEATATTEVLVAGEAGGEQAKTLVHAALVGGAYDFIVSTFELWREVFTTTTFAWGQRLAQSVRIDFRINVGAAITGLGYIVGLKYSAIICAGSLLSWWVLVPIVSYIGGGLSNILGSSADNLIRDMTPLEIFTNYVRHIGIGGIAMAGMVGVLKSWRIIVGAFRLVATEVAGGGLAGGAATERTQRDLPMKWIAAFTALSIVATFLFFWLGVVDKLSWALTGLIIVTVIAFLFTTVAARAIAIVGTNPVSGMTLMTLIISAFLLTRVGLSGNLGIVAALLIGGVVCTALSTAGAFISDLKIGYWAGTTPATQERWKFLGILFASAAVGGVILLLNKTYGFGAESGGLEAPQASAMAAVIRPLMTGAEAPWILYLAGCLLALVLEMIKVPPLAFALGMYLPLHLNTPLLAGGIIAHIVQSRSQDPAVNQQRKEKGTLIASGFIAGGAIMGVVSALIIFFGRMIAGDDQWNVVRALHLEHWATENPGSAVLSIVAFLLLCIFLARVAMSRRKD
jgi:putative OPT family oligopeptide transporter